MRFEQLSYLMAVDEYHSMNKASEEIFVSQQSISSAIKDLEDEMNVKLVLRTNKGSYLTDAGRELVQAARQFYESYDVIIKKYQTKVEQNEETLHLVFEISLISYYEIVCLHFSEYHPKTKLKYSVKPFGGQLNTLDDDPYAIVLTGFNDQQLEKVRKHYACDIIWSSRFALCVSEKSMYAGYNSISIDSIRNMRILFYCAKEEPSFSVYALEPYELEKHGNTYIFNTTRRLQGKYLEKPDVVTFFPENVSPSTAAIPFVRVPLKEKIGIHLCLVTKKNEYLREVGKLLREAVSQHRI